MTMSSESQARLLACSEEKPFGAESRSGSRITGTVIRYDEILGSITSLLIALDHGLDVVYWNTATMDALGLSCDLAIGKRITSLPLSWNAAAVLETLDRCRLANAIVRLDDLDYARRDGTPARLGLKVSPLRDRDGAQAGFLIQGADITDRRRLENEFLQAQKMDAVGRLAGNIAHDFNNVLTIVMGQCDLLLNIPYNDDQRRERYHEIRDCAQRAAELTKQLLHFSRKQYAPSSGCSLNRVLEDSKRFLAKAVGENIQLEIETGAFPSRVALDPVHLTQVLLNLAVNARDAMPQGGRLHIATDSPSQAPTGADPGLWVRLSISDSGDGIEPAIRDRIFEPFFTTKGKHKGTGLGLSTVYAIVKQAGGHITVSSEPGRGASFEIVLPCLADKLFEDEPVIPESLGGLRGTETVLLVEDEQSVREMVSQLLASLGYKVLSSADCTDALHLAKEAESISLLLTDWMMPQLNGLQLADRVRQTLPQCRVLLISGYPQSDEWAARKTDTAFLQKPFSLLDIARAVRRVLDGVPQADN